MASVGAELWVAGKPCGLGSLSTFLAWGHLEALCFLLPPESLTAPLSLGNEEANSAHTFYGISFPPVSPGSMPVWKQDVEKKLATLDNLIAQSLVPTTGSTEQQRLRR